MRGGDVRLLLRLRRQGVAALEHLGAPKVDEYVPGTHNGQTDARRQSELTIHRQPKVQERNEDDKAAFAKWLEEEAKIPQEDTLHRTQRAHFIHFVKSEQHGEENHVKSLRIRAASRELFSHESLMSRNGSFICAYHKHVGHRIRGPV